MCVRETCALQILGSRLLDHSGNPQPWAALGTSWRGTSSASNTLRVYVFVGKVGTNQSQTCCLLCCLYQSPEEENILLLLLGKFYIPNGSICPGAGGRHHFLAAVRACWSDDSPCHFTFWLLLYQDSSSPSLEFWTAKFSFACILMMATLPLR